VYICASEREKGELSERDRAVRAVLAALDDEAVKQKLRSIR
jgi:hypothetical protein